MWANEGECTAESLMRSGTKDLAAAMSCGDATELGVTKKAMHELLNGLARLHACGVVHRDVKPAHILVRFELKVRAVLADFGLAPDTSTNPSNVAGSLAMDELLTAHVCTDTYVAP